MSIYFTVLSILVTSDLVTNGRQIGFIEEPQFTYLERNVVEAKYKIGNNITGINSSLYFCCTCNLSLPDILSDNMCPDQPKCPNYGELKDCRLKGQFKHCHVSRYILPDVIFKGYVVQKDANNQTLQSKLATYITSDTAKAPRPVANLKITLKGSGLYLKWTPSTPYTRTTKYTQLVSCQPSGNRNAKAFRKMLEFRQSSLVVDFFNITAVTKYLCCVQVENVVTSVMSECTCKSITSPEQAPSSAPVILCGNGTVCPFVAKGTERNVTILFKLPNVNDRNGKIIRHVITYRNESDSNQTTLEIMNGSATNATLVGLNTQTSYLVSMKSCTKVECSPSSNTIRIQVMESPESGKIQTKIIVIVTVSIAVGVGLVFVLLYCLWRSKRLERGDLPKLELPTHLDYYYPTADVEDTYNVLVTPETSVPSEENPVPSEENPVNTTDDDR